MDGRREPWPRTPTCPAASPKQSTTTTTTTSRAAPTTHHNKTKEPTYLPRAPPPPPRAGVVFEPPPHTEPPQSPTARLLCMALAPARQALRHQGGEPDTRTSQHGISNARLCSSSLRHGTLALRDTPSPAGGDTGPHQNRPPSPPALQRGSPAAGGPVLTVLASTTPPRGHPPGRLTTRRRVHGNLSLASSPCECDVSR